MKYRWAALVTVLALSALLAQTGFSQSQQDPPIGQQRSAGSLKQNVPNPFNPTTTIPFDLGMEGDPPVCKDPAKQFRVSLRIYDLLYKLVAIPILQGGGDNAGRPLENMLLNCGSDYAAFWDGFLLNTRQQVSSGVYIYVLEVDGKAALRRMTVSKE